MLNECPACHQASMRLYGEGLWKCPVCYQEATPPDEPDEVAAMDALRERMREADKPGHGGYRPGAGRIAKRGPTEVMRVPLAYKAAVLALIEHLDSTKDINRHYAPVESGPIFVRSLHGKAQRLIFRTEPVVFGRQEKSSQE